MYTRQDWPLRGSSNYFMIFEFTLLGTRSAHKGDQRSEKPHNAWIIVIKVDPETVKHRGETEKSHVDFG
jgi:hypothetical protein